MVFTRYMRWLHTQWPAGTVEKLPKVNEDGSTNVPGLFVVGDLTGIPLLKFSADTGAKVVERLSQGDGQVADAIIIGAGVSGMAAALAARKRGLTFELLEAGETFSTIVNFPRGKPIYTYPTDMTPAGDLQFTAQVKEPLLDELRAQTEGIPVHQARAERVSRSGGLLHVHLDGGETLDAHNVIVAIGRTGNFRTLGVPGENLDKVSNRLHDPKDFAGQNVLVVGGGDSALETAIALVQGGASTTLSYRKPEFSRAKPENVAAVHALVADPGADVSVEQPSSERVSTATGRWVKGMPGESAASAAGSLRLELGSHVQRMDADSATLKLANGSEEQLPNHAVFSMIGREAPLDFFRRSGVKVKGDRGKAWWISLLLIVLFCVWMYHWKKDGWPFPAWPGTGITWKIDGLVSKAGETINAWAHDPTTLFGTLISATHDPGFFYSLAYCSLVVIFGFRRIRRRRTPYVRLQTCTLMAVQLVPLFLLPYFLLPWMGANGWFADGGALQWFGDQFFPGGSYWRSFGFILAWPLFVYNLFDQSPTTGWLILGLVQTFVIIPLIVWKWGKGAYCGWICSCGALAETLGDAHREKMPHGPKWNRLNMAGQIILAIAFLILAIRVVGWIVGPGSGPDRLVTWMLHDAGKGFLSYAYVVDLLLAGIIGVALYFHFSGRVWCRFFCPLAALMHIYARFSKFRIVADKKKCISCNVCTSVCHQGIDVMNFANKGIPMDDPECVRCSACVQSCPTGVLQFGEVNRKTGAVIRLDSLPASPVLMREAKKADGA